jgi:flagellar motor switch protein FliN/FliY
MTQTLTKTKAKTKTEELLPPAEEMAYPKEMAPVKEAPVKEAPAKEAPAGPASRPIEFLKDIKVQASVELGRVDLTIGDVLKLAPGSFVHLDKMAGEPVELMVKDKLIARGEVVVIDDKFGLRIIEIVSLKES